MSVTDWKKKKFKQWIKGKAEKANKANDAQTVKGVCSLMIFVCLP